MPNLENLKPFTSENQPPPESKSRKGIKNRSTIARLVLETAVKFPDELTAKVQELFPDFSKETTGEIAATYMQLVKAITDKDTAAYKALMDSAYGTTLPEEENGPKADITVNITF